MLDFYELLNIKKKSSEDILLDAKRCLGNLYPECQIKTISEDNNDYCLVMFGSQETAERWQSRCHSSILVKYESNDLNQEFALQIGPVSLKLLASLKIDIYQYTKQFQFFRAPQILSSEDKVLQIPGQCSAFTRFSRT